MLKVNNSLLKKTKFSNILICAVLPSAIFYPFDGYCQSNDQFVVHTINQISGNNKLSIDLKKYVGFKNGNSEYDPIESKLSDSILNLAVDQFKVKLFANDLIKDEDGDIIESAQTNDNDNTFNFLINDKPLNGDDAKKTLCELSKKYSVDQLKTAKLAINAEFKIKTKYGVPDLINKKIQLEIPLANPILLTGSCVTSLSYSKPGTYQFSLSPNVTKAHVVVKGAGGGGGGGGSDANGVGYNGGMGGNGYLYEGDLNIANKYYSCDVGAGGQGGLSNLSSSSPNTAGGKGGSYQDGEQYSRFHGGNGGRWPIPNPFNGGSGGGGAAGTLIVATDYKGDSKGTVFLAGGGAGGTGANKGPGINGGPGQPIGGNRLKDGYAGTDSTGISGGSGGGYGPGVVAEWNGYYWRTNNGISWGGGGFTITNNVTITSQGARGGKGGAGGTPTEPGGKGEDGSISVTEYFPFPKIY